MRQRLTTIFAIQVALLSASSAPDSLRRGEFTRPIRISVWYPARPARGARAMRHRQYFQHRAPNPYFARLDSIIETADVDPTRRFTFGGSDSLFQAFLALEQRKASLAVQVFRLNVEAHSSSADAYDSLADGLIPAGDHRGTRRAYE